MLPLRRFEKFDLFLVAYQRFQVRPLGNVFIEPVENFSECSLQRGKEFLNQTARLIINRQVI